MMIAETESDEAQIIHNFTRQWSLHKGLTKEDKGLALCALRLSVLMLVKTSNILFEHWIQSLKSVSEDLYCKGVGENEDNKYEGKWIACFSFLSPCWSINSATLWVFLATVYQRMQCYIVVHFPILFPSSCSFVSLISWQSQWRLKHQVKGIFSLLFCFQISLIFP